MPSKTVHCPKCDRLLEIPHRSGDAGGLHSPSKPTSVFCLNCGSVSTAQNLDPTIMYRQEQVPEPNTRVGHFSLIRRLGHGSAGEVWLAEDINLGRQVALKLPRSPDQETMSLLFEAKTAASLRHPQIVSVYEVGLDGEQVFIASEFIDGMTLRDFLSAGKPKVEVAVDLLTRIARALHYAHQQGIVHRDVKPANILLNQERQPYVADFGLAKRIDANETISNDGQVVGTAKYMSPEQASGNTRQTDARSDLYALGVIMFEMLTSEVPFRGNVRAILDQKANLDPPTPRALNPSLAKDLETICLKCLEREPLKRYSTMLELAEELERFTTGEPIRARPISRLERAWRWCRRRPVVAGLIAGLFLSLSLGLLGVTFFWRQAERSAVAARQSLYRSQMNLASVHLNSGDISGVREMLNRVAADPEVSRLRGFEWNYFDRQIAPVVPVANQGEPVTEVAVSRDGDICVSIGRDPQIRVWDARSGELVRSLVVADTVIFQAIEFSPTTMHLASGSVDGFVRVWNPLQDGRVMQQMQHGPQVTLVRFSPDGKRLLAAGVSGAVRIWSVADGTLFAEIPTGKRGATKDVQFSADGKKIVVATDDGHLRVWDLDRFKNDPQPDLEFDSSPLIETIALSNDGKLVATGTYHGTLTLHTSEGLEKFVHKSTWGRIGDLEFIAGTSLLAVAANDGKLHVFETDQKREVRSLETHGLTAGALARSANGKSLVIGSGDGAVMQVKSEDMTKPSILWHEGPVRDLEFLPGGSRLVATYDSDVPRIWNLESGESQSFNTGSARTVKTMSVQPSGKLLAGGGSEPHVVLWDIDSLSVVRELPIPPTGTRFVQFSPLGRRLAVATRRGPVHIYQATNWDQSPVNIAPSGKVNALTFSADDQLLAVASETGSIELFDAASGGLRESSIKVKSEPSALQFCDVGRVLAIGTSTGEIHLWDIPSHRVRAVIKGHTARINVLAILPGTQTLISAGRDRDLKLWDLPSGELIAPLTGHHRQVFSLAVTPDGGMIASGSLEGDIRIWHGSRQGASPRSRNK